MFDWQFEFIFIAKNRDSFQQNYHDDGTGGKEKKWMMMIIISLNIMTMIH